jgi:hypothetical protein
MEIKLFMEGNGVALMSARMLDLWSAFDGLRSTSWLADPVFSEAVD